MRKAILVVVFSAWAGAAAAGPYDPLDPCVLKSGDEAIAACTSFLKAPGDDKAGIPMAYTARGKAYYEKQQYEQAIADLNQTLALAPRSTEAHYWRAFGLSSADKDVEAIPDYDALLAADPKDLFAGNAASNLCRRGRAYLMKGGEDARGFADMDKAIAVKPDYLYCYQQQADAYAKRGNVEQAIAVLGKAIAAKPNDRETSDVYKARAQLHADRGANDKALADYTRATEVNPTDTPSFFSRALLLEKLGRTDEALADHDTLLKLKPGDSMYAGYRAKLIKAKAEAPAKATLKAEECSWWSSLLGRCAKTAP